MTLEDYTPEEIETAKSKFDKAGIWFRREGSLTFFSIFCRTWDELTPSLKLYVIERIKTLEVEK